MGRHCGQAGTNTDDVVSNIMRMDEGGPRNLERHCNLTRKKENDKGEERKIWASNKAKTEGHSYHSSRKKSKNVFRFFEPSVRSKSFPFSPGPARKNFRGFSGRLRTVNFFMDLHAKNHSATFGGG